MKDIGWICKICHVQVTPNDVFLHYARHHRLMTTYAAPVYVTEALVPIVEEPAKAEKPAPVKKAKKKAKAKPAPVVDIEEEQDEDELEEEDIETEDLNIEEEE